MKILKKLLPLLLAVLLTAGCGAPAAQTHPPTEPVTEPTQLVTEPEGDLLLAEFQALFSDCDRIFTQAASHSYTRPEDLDLYYLFYNGFETPAGFDALDAHSRQQLMAMGYGTEFDRQTMPLDTMGSLLRQHFGLGLEAFRMPYAWEHDPDADTWHSDHPRPWSGAVTVNDYDLAEDGTTRLYLTVPAFVTPMGEIVRDADTVMTVRSGDGGWRILSNVWADHRTEQERLAEYQSLFTGFHAMAAGHTFARPEDADLYYLFYNGVGFDGGWGSIGSGDQKLLESQGFWREMDIQVMPANLLEEKLNRYLGLGLADVKIPDEWVYSADTDTYYSNHNDAYFSGVTVNGYTDNADGSVTLFLTVDALHDHDFEEVVWEAATEMTLRPTSDGWRIVSHESTGAEDFEKLLSWSGGDYFRALGTIFNTTEDVDLYYFFYGGVDYPARWDELDGAERDYLLAQGLWEELDLQKMPAQLLEERLRQYFGIGLADVKIPDRWVYYAPADSYYTNHSDAWLPFAVVTDVEEFADGTVRVYLTVDMVIDHTGEYVSDAETVLTLRKTDEGYRIVTHVFAQDVV